MVLQFVEDEIIQQFGFPRTIVSDTATTFMGTEVQNYVKNMKITWTLILTYETSLMVEVEVWSEL